MSPPSTAGVKRDSEPSSGPTDESCANGSDPRGTRKRGSADDEAADVGGAGFDAEDGIERWNDELSSGEAGVLASLTKKESDVLYDTGIGIDRVRVVELSGACRKSSNVCRATEEGDGGMDEASKSSKKPPAALQSTQARAVWFRRRKESKTGAKSTVAREDASHESGPGRSGRGGGAEDGAAGLFMSSSKTAEARMAWVRKRKQDKYHAKTAKGRNGAQSESSYDNDQSPVDRPIASLQCDESNGIRKNNKGHALARIKDPPPRMEVAHASVEGLPGGSEGGSKAGAKEKGLPRLEIAPAPGPNDGHARIGSNEVEDDLWPPRFQGDTVLGVGAAPGAQAVSGVDGFGYAWQSSANIVSNGGGVENRNAAIHGVTALETTTFEAFAVTPAVRDQQREASLALIEGANVIAVSAASSAAKNPSRGWQTSPRRRRCVALLVALGIFAIVAVIAIPLSLRGRSVDPASAEQETEEQPIISTLRPSVSLSSQAPSMAITSQPSLAPTSRRTIAPTSERVEFIRAALCPKQPSSCTLDSSSPQYRSILWLAEEDPLQISPENEVALEQRYALVCIYFATGGRDGSWLDDFNFLSANHECQWNEMTSYQSLPDSDKKGVLCDKGGNVTSLLLYANGLSGSIPEEINLLYYLEDLFLGNNRLTGELPINSHTNLLNLYLSDNALNGTVPYEAARFPRLSQLWLARNAFTGPVPMLGNLEVVDLSENNLSGALERLGDGSGGGRIRHLDLGTNGLLSGTIPDFFAANDYRLEGLEYLSLKSCQLTGTIPGSMGQSCRRRLPTKRSTNWIHIDLSNNFLQGPMPLLSGDMGRLQFLDVSNNDLTGQLSDTLPGWWTGYISPLVTLALNGNSFSGTVPTSYAEISTLSYFALEHNNFTGGISTLCTISGLRTLKSDCQEPNPKVECGCCNWCCKDGTCSPSGYRSTEDRYREIRRIVSGVTGADVLNDAGTPQARALEWIAKGDPLWVGQNDTSRLLQRYALATIFLSTGRSSGWFWRYNFLTGRDECSWNDGANGAFCHNEGGVVDELSLRFNYLSGSIPDEIKLLSNLATLNLHHNGLSGTAPSSLQQLTNLEILRLDNNSLEGNVDFLCDMPLRVLGLGFLTCSCCAHMFCYDDGVCFPNSHSSNERTTALKLSLQQTSAEFFPQDASSYWQLRALSWLADEDAAQIRADDTKRVIQRFSLAVLYFSTNGYHWYYSESIPHVSGIKAQNYFMSVLHECEWSTGRQGVLCDADENVTEIRLGFNGLDGVVPTEITRIESLRFIAVGCVDPRRHTETLAEQTVLPTPTMLFCSQDFVTCFCASCGDFLPENIDTTTIGC